MTCDRAADADALAALEQARAEALVAADIARLEAITDDDYVHVEANGRVRDKLGFLDAIRSGGVRFGRYEVRDNLIRFYGDTAVVTGTFENRIERADGSGEDRQGRHCRVYVWRRDRWKNVLHQVTECLV